ncbi:MAG: DUF4403 family protein [Synergistales bacterium]|nr:DUF4403 family protein [Synergistales bacterium]
MERRRKWIAGIAGAVVLGVAGFFLLMPRPEPVVVDAPEVRPVPTLPARESSMLALPVELPLRELEHYCERQIPIGLFSQKDQGLDDDGHFSISSIVSRDRSLSLDTKSDALHLNLPLRFMARIAWKDKILGIPASYHETTRGSMVLHIGARPRFTPDWKVQTSPDISYSWQKRPTVKALGTLIQVSGLMEHFLDREIDRILPTIDRRLNSTLQLHDTIDEQWRRLYEPIPLSTSPDIWLQARPRSLTVWPLQMEQDRVVLPVRLATYLEVVTEKPSADIRPEPLPPMEERGDVADVSVLHLPLQVSYGALERHLMEAMPPQGFSLPNGGRLKLDELSCMPSGGQLILRARFHAEAPWRLFGTHGTLYLVGTPRFDRAAGELSLTDLEFHANTTNALLQGAAWLLKAPIAGQLEQRAVFPLSEDIREARATVDRSLREVAVAPGLQLSGEIDEVRFSDVLVEEAALRIDMHLVGSVRVRYTPPLP